MLKVGLYGAEFFARHGFYEEEQITGNRFLVDAEVEFVPENNLTADELDHTINYEQLYHIVQQEMAHTRKLLETVAQGIADRINQQFPFIKRLSVTVKKLNPPLQGRVDYSAVTVSLP